MATAGLTKNAPGASEIPWSEVQGVILRGFANLPHSRFILLRFDGGAGAATWLRQLLDEDALRFGWGSGKDLRPALALAFTSVGLRALGLDDAAIEQFAPEFVEGMTALSRPRKFGDTGDSAPDRWLWGSGDSCPHAVLLVYAATDAELLQVVERERGRFTACGMVELRSHDGSDLGTCQPLDERREHFGFADGISQPVFRDEPRGARSRHVAEADRVATGELLLGYANEAGIFPRSPRLSPEVATRVGGAAAGADLGKNGSYLVYRQLEQDVGAFWSAMAKHAEAPTLESKVWLASKIVGRTPDGAPLSTLDQPRDTAPVKPEGFDFAHEDPHGLKCPFGAHIRRSNPRATLAADPETGLAKSKKHRILRRGRSYGVPFADVLTPEELSRAAEAGTGRPGPRGIHFMCFNADIANQFEFVQQTWINGPTFQGLHGEVDPLVGDPTLTDGLFTIPGEPIRCRVKDLPRFVSVKGGAYFFAPSKLALGYLAALK